MTAPRTPAPAPVSIRAARPGDEPALAEICIATGDGGRDARARYPEPEVLADIFLRPYLRFAPAWCRVAEDDRSVCGYVVATPDTLDFARRTEAAWWPALRRRHPLPDPGDDRPQAQLVRRLHAGVLDDLPFLRSHPAHLHIDLLPHAQGRGVGTRLMTDLLGALEHAGVPGVHLGVAAGNARALAFYAALGFEPLERHGWGCWLGRRLAAGAPPVTGRS